MLVCLALQKCCDFLQQKIFLLAGYLLDYSLALYVAYSSATYYLTGYACSGVSFLDSGGQGVFLPRHIGGGLVIGLAIINVLVLFVSSIIGCVLLEQRPKKFQDDVSSSSIHLKN